jgi:hypothetical protein
MTRSGALEHQVLEQMRQPVCPGAPFLEPTPYHKFTATAGARRSGETITCSPFVQAFGLEGISHMSDHNRAEGPLLREAFQFVGLGGEGVDPVHGLGRVSVRLRYGASGRPEHGYRTRL